MSQHEVLWQLVKQLPTDFEPYGSRSRRGVNPTWISASTSGLRRLRLDARLASDHTWVGFNLAVGQRASRAATRSLRSGSLRFRR